jgi:hypothetical protein
MDITGFRSLLPFMAVEVMGDEWNDAGRAPASARVDGYSAATADVP